MGESNNRFYNELIEPNVLALLQPCSGQKILDLACGHGNFSRKLASQGCMVTGIDFSSNLIKAARKRSENCNPPIEYVSGSLTDPAVLTPFSDQEFHHIVSNMALMDISDISVLAAQIPRLLKPSGHWVFSIMHPCFQSPGARQYVETTDEGGVYRHEKGLRVKRYIDSEYFLGLALSHQPEPQYYFHRSLTALLQIFLNHGLAVTGICEPVFQDDRSDRFEWTSIPAVLIIRMDIR